MDKKLEKTIINKYMYFRNLIETEGQCVALYISFKYV